MRKNAINFLYAIDCYLLYMLSGVAASAIVVAYYSINAAREFDSTGVGYLDFTENLAAFLSGKSSFVLLVSYILVILALLVVFMIKRRSLGAYSGLSYVKVPSVISSLLLGVCLGVITYRFVPSGSGVGEEITAVLLLCIIIGPFVEELMFRSILLKMFGASSGMFFSVVITSVLFAFSHTEGVQIVYTFALGLILALVRIKSTSLWNAIALHLAFNVSGAYLAVSGLQLDIPNTVFVSVLAVVLLFFACSGGRKRIRKQD